MISEKTKPHGFILTGFSQDQGVRRFAFEGIGADNARTQLAVHADLALTRVYGIHLQELPLLCRELLERRTDSEVVVNLTFTEDDMRLFRDDRLAARQAARDRKPARRPRENPGTGWRTTLALSIQNRA